MTDSAIIEATDLVKTFDEVRALDGVSFAVPKGTVFGLLGPNGAGKTTAVRILTTLLRPDSGSATIAGFDVAHDARAVRRVIGLAGQYAAVDENLTGLENLELVGRLYHFPVKDARRRGEHLLERFGLTDAAQRLAKGYSGGMRRRLDLAASLVGEPDVLFLDEPTAGLDPRSRIALWEIIEELVGDGTTLLLTTQYLEEADRLADKIAVIDHGRVIDSGTATELKSRVGGEVVDLMLAEPARTREAEEILAACCLADADVDVATGRLTAPLDGGGGALPDIVRRLDDAGIILANIALRQPTLDDVFLTLTGHAAEEASAEEQEVADNDGEAKRRRRRPEPRQTDRAGT